MRIGIVGSSNYSNTRTIKDILFDLKNRDDKLIITTRGLGNFDLYIKKLCAEFGIRYQEIPRFDDEWNARCPGELKPYYFSRPYHSKYFFVQLGAMVKYNDIILSFVAHKNELNAKLFKLINAESIRKKKEIIYVQN